MSSLIDGSQAAIREILRTCHIIAVVGLSSRKLRPGYYVPQYLQAAGYRIIPVNPELEHALGEQAYPDLASVPEQIDRYHHLHLVQFFICNIIKRRWINVYNY